MDSLQCLSQQDLLDAERFFRTTFVNGLSGFKSVCLCGSISSKGQHNLSLISSVVHVGANPPYMGMLMRPHTVPRDTLENILETGYFTLNHLREEFFEAAHQTAARYPRETSEFEATGLQPVFSEHHPAPYVGESHVRIGLTYKERHDLLNGTVLIVGEVQEVFFPEDCLREDGYLDLHKAGSLTVASLDAYHSTEPIARMAYAKPDQAPQRLE